MKRTSIRILALLLVVASTVRAQETAKLPTIPVAEFGERRDRLQKAFEGVIVLMEADPILPGMENIDANTARYDFVYLAVYHREGDIFAIHPESGATLFVNGKIEPVKTASGLADVRALGEFPRYLAKSLPGSKKALTRLRKDANKIVDAVQGELGGEIESANQKIGNAITRL